MRGSLLVISMCLLGACGAQISEATKSSVDRQVAQLSTGSEVYAPPADNAPMPLAEGQWIKQHMVDKDGNHSFVTTKVLSMSGDRTWLETETESYYGTTAIKMLVTLGDQRDPSTFDLHDYWIKQDDGSIEQFPPVLVATMKPTVRGALADVAIVHEPEGQADVASPAGQFQQAYRARVSANVMGRTFVSDAWWHPRVPLSGGVRSVGVDPVGTVELVGFGESGAVSVFP